MKKILPIIFIVLVLGLVGIYYYYFTNNKYSPEQGVPSVPTVIKEVFEESPVVKVSAQKLRIPWEIVFLPNGNALVTERVGRVRLIEMGVLRESPFATISDVYAIGEGGLLGMTLHPNFKTNQYIYVYYTYREGDRALNKVKRFRVENNSFVEDKVIIDKIPGADNHNGGRIKFGPDGKLYITAGDSLNANLAQDKSSLAGKILRLNDDGSIPGDNPFSGSPVYSYGHRNPQGLAWDRNGQLWETEHGPQAHDEVNQIKKGANYGWPVIKGDESKDGMERPFIQSGNMTWAPSGMTIQGNNIIYSGLAGRAVFVLDPATKTLTKYFEGQYGRIRTVNQSPSGDLYILTSNLDGRNLTPDPTDDRVINIALPTK